MKGGLLKILKVLQLVFSLMHLGLQFFFFNNIINVTGVRTILPSRIDAEFLSNASLTMSQECFVFLGLSLLTLAFYITLSFHISQWIMENRLESSISSQMNGEAEKE